MMRKAYRISLLLSVVAYGAQCNANIFSLPLTKRTATRSSLPIGRRDVASSAMFEDQGFWFANFSVGAASNLELLMDTGSSDLYLNPGEYRPSASSRNLHSNFSITFATTEPDGTGILTITGNKFQDSATLSGTNLTVAQQELGVITNSSGADIPRNGLIGLAGLDSSALGANSWFSNLCANHAFSECRFGMALETNETGMQYFGGVEKDRFKGELTNVPIENEWSTWGDIVFNDTVFQKDAEMITDSGTAVIFGPLDIVQKLFDAAGIQSVMHYNLSGLSPTQLIGYYPCDNPPTFGFSLPSATNASQAATNASSPVSHTSRIFNVLPRALAENSTDGNCTSYIHGLSDFTVWLVGQPLFQGHYVDHNVDNQTMGWADLV